MLALTGSGNGPPSLDDIVRLFQRLTGRVPTPEDVRQARKVLERDEPIEEK
jgi:hypothetical protein